MERGDTDRPLGMSDNGWRRRHSHQESHAEAAPASAVPDHPLIAPAPPVMVSDRDALGRMVDTLAAAGQFAFDSEFVGESSYQPQLCLVQAATPREVFLIDPMEALDLTPLWELLAEPAVEKTVLAGQQDFLPAVQALGRPPANVLDLQVAAGFVCVDYPLSLQRLIERYVGLSLPKSMTFTHWQKRPLSKVQLRYAADDVRYLAAARGVIAEQLQVAGRMEWARQECRTLLEDMAVYVSPRDRCYLRVRGNGRLGGRQLAVLRELAAWRDAAAERENVPPRTLVKDGVLLSLARRMPPTVGALDAIKGLPRPVEYRYGGQIVEAIAAGVAVPAGSCPPAECDDGSRPGNFEQLWQSLNDLCAGQGISPALVASKKEFARLYSLADRGLATGGHRLASGWRGELLAPLLSGII